MRGVLTIARLFGIPVQLHWTFSLVVVWLAYRGWQSDWSGPEFLRAALPLIALFLCVILHEFGHALTARRYGVETRDIILSPIGGVARMTRLPDKPFQEWMVAAAGPLVNIALAAALLLPVLGNPRTRQKLLNVFDYNSNYLFLNLNLWEYLALSLLLLNLLLALFNLLPAFPMDGGRMLRALLATRFSRTKATRLATYLGQAIAVLFVAYGLYAQQNLLLVFIGIFVYVMGSAEYKMVKTDDWLTRQCVKDYARRHFTRLYPQDPMELVAEISSRGREKSYLVFNDWQEVVGVLSGKHIMKAVREKAFQAPVKNYFMPTREGVAEGDSLRTAMHTMQKLELTALPVYKGLQVTAVLDATAVDRALKDQPGRGKRKAG